MMNIKFLGLLFMAFMLIACQHKVQEARIEYNLEYGVDTRNRIDVYLPKNRNENTPVILLIHPGAWMSGDKEIMSRMADSLYQRDIVVVNVNTRFVSKTDDIRVVFEDIDSILSYCKRKSIEWGIKEDGYAIGGSSSGGHIAMLYAYTTYPSSKISAIVAFATPSNVSDTAWLRSMVKENITEKVEWMCGQQYIIGTIPDKTFIDKSPIFQIAPIPTFMVHGDVDEIIPFSQSLEMEKELNKRNIPNHLFVMKNMGHVIGYKDPVIFSNVMSQIQEWLLKYSSK